MYQKRTRSQRLPGEDDLEPPTCFGEQLALDHMIVSKASRGREYAILMVRDAFSGVIQAYPAKTRNQASIRNNLVRFPGTKCKLMTPVVRSDHADEFIAAVQELGTLCHADGLTMLC